MMPKNTICAVLTAVATSLMPFTTNAEPADTARSTYVGSQGGFDVHRLDLADIGFTIELLHDAAGDRVLIVSNQNSGLSQTFILPAPRKPSQGADSVRIQTEIEARPIIVRNDGSGFYGIYEDGVLIGFLSISSDGTFTFTPEEK